MPLLAPTSRRPQEATVRFIPDRFEKVLLALPLSPTGERLDSHAGRISDYGNINACLAVQLADLWTADRDQRLLDSSRH